MSCLLVILFLLGIAITTNLSEATRHETKLLSSAVVVGTVYCDTCFEQDFSQTSHFISGASVAVECKYGTSKPSFLKEVRTDEHGEFEVHLPFYVSKHVKRIEGCQVKLINSSEPYCSVASTATSSSLHLKSRKQGTHIFSAGLFTFKPLKQPILCDQKPSIQNPKQLFYRKVVSLSPTNYLGYPSPSSQDPIVPDLLPTHRNYLPPLPRLPELPHLPQLPPLPRLPELPPLPQLPPLLGLPFPPKPGKTIKSKSSEYLKKSQLQDQKVAQPDLFFPRLLPSNPFKPSLLIPKPFQPSPPPSIPFPPIPGFSTPSPPPQSQPFPFPPFSPVPTSPRIPGIPPASSSKPASP
ncbi:36.4 kDa proline-rich protein-like [Juglans microcarpa x Juglans regia]|uniref:36.4 kDa proline-rich protein-like n=1 Tax=Juglans microcarpa x Juglans regia TaxID=2249226 RepID=UPI001B7E1AB6|nr:36.4 kDa proline-rich protein-like [Juglans microcarpa x Juglans regia]